jgi:hemerythrin
MSVEVKLLDNDHKKLLILLNELHYAVFHRQARQILDSVMDRLIKQIRVHFAHEEQFFTETAYPGAVAHEREHTRLIEHARIQQQRFRNCTDVESCLQVVEMLKNCLFNHIEREDRQYVPHFKAREMGAILAANEAPPAAVQRIRAIGSRIMQGAW